MGHPSLRECVEDLEQSGRLLRVEEEVDPHLEVAEIQRRLYASGGPAVLFTRLRGTAFPAVCNLYGTLERCRYIFRDTLESVRKVVSLKADPKTGLRAPWRFATTPWTALKTLPWRRSTGPVLAHETRIGELPQIVSWPDDGGPFITLPQVYTEDPAQPGALRSNLGMYRVQLGGNEYLPDREIGLHYQIHRGIGVHHQAAITRGEPLRVSIFVGGPPAHAFAAVLPLPEGLSELVFAGMLAGRRFRYAKRHGHTISTEADFCIVGRVHPGYEKPEGPFGDHLGYYSLTHDFPVLEIEHVWHRSDAIWPFTVVGRPPQEDSSFGQLIHELTAPMLPKEIPGLRSMHAVDAAGVHPLLLAVGSERYVPYRPREPQEILTIAHAVLGFGQASLAKYVLIVAGEDDPELDAHDVERHLRHLLERVDWRRDLHFSTRTTIDTLDYSGSGFNQGSKLVIAAAGEVRRQLGETPPRLEGLPEGFGDLRVAMNGVLVVGAPSYGDESGGRHIESLLQALEPIDLASWPLLIVVDDSEFAARDLRNFLWVTFTRSNPATDVHGVRSFTVDKHWGAEGSLVIDARIKPHHAPPLIEDPTITRRVDELAKRGGPLHGVI